MSESGTPDATRRRRRGSSSSPAELASPLEDEDLLQEILLCLPPQPSSLLRASAVCKLWRGLIIDPKFLRRFRDRHREPPLLGFFENFGGRAKFRSILNPPDRISPKRLDLGSTARRKDDLHLLDCRHGRVLLLDFWGKKVVVCDPVTGERRRLSVPPELHGPRVLGDINININGAVLCAAGDQGHVHGSCHSSPFKVVLVSMGVTEIPPLASVYSSETGIWGSIISTAVLCRFLGTGRPATLIGNAIYWISLTGPILEFHLNRESLVLINEPPGRLNEPLGQQIVKADDGDVGLAISSESSFEMWHRKVNFQGVTTWFLRKTVDMHIVLGISPQIKRNREHMLGYDEDTDMIFLYMHGAVHMVHLKSMQYKKKLYETDRLAYYHPFKSFFPPGIAIAAEYDGAEVLHGGLIR